MQDPQLRKRLASLSPSERTRLVQKLKERKKESEGSQIGKAQPERIEPDTGARLYPAAPGQERMYFLHEYTGRSTTYSTSACFYLEGDLDFSRLEHAFRSLISRHDSLRTRFFMEHGRLWQRILPEADFSIQLNQAEGGTPKERTEAAMESIKRHLDTPFDLTHDALIKAALVQIEENAAYLLIQSHHIISDGWSFNILLKEISEFYNAFVNGTAPALDSLDFQLADFSQWQMEKLDSGEWEDGFSYWADNLADEPAPLEFPWDYERKVNQEPAGGNLYRPIAPETFEKLTILASREKATLFMVLLTAFKLHVLQHTGESDLIIGVPIANRLQKESEPIIGCLINTLALRTDCSGDPPFAKLLERVRSTSLNAFQHQEVPFDRVIKRLDLKRYPGRPPLFQTHFTLQNFPPSTLEMPGIQSTRVSLNRELSKFDYSIAIERYQDGWRTKFDYNKQVFKEETVRNMADSWDALLDKIIARPDDAVSSIIATGRSSSNVPLQRTECTAACLHTRFEFQAKTTPDSVAVQSGDTTICFRELDERANQVAHRLIENGLNLETAVGLSTSRSIEMIIGMLGILKAGGAYLPIDPDWPEQRKFQIIEDADLDTILTVTDLSIQFKNFQGTLLNLDDQALSAGSKTSNPERAVSPENLAYVLYTSGSTGTPKGVMVEHRHLDSYLSGLNEVIPFGPGSYAMTQPLTADACLTMLMPPLVLGGCLHLISRECSLSPKKLAKYLKANRIDYFKSTPTHLGALLEVFPTPDLLPEKLLVLGGEVLPVGLVNKIGEFHPRCRIWNQYGPTETTVGVLANEVPLELDSNWDHVPIGKPFPGVSVHILDESGCRVPDGEAGEIYIGGKTLARGYLKDSERTRQVFIPNHLDPASSDRLYRTGDRGWFLPDGSVQFGGRLDDQVKISGYRIEPGEIEAVLGECPGIRDKVVLPDRDPSGVNRLRAFVIANKAVALDPDAVRQFLSERLPEAMVPTKIEIIDRIPLTPMGKMDREALLNRGPHIRIPETETKPTTSNDSRSLDIIIDACRELLGRDDIAGHQSFFDIGGTSLSAMRLAGRIGESSGMEFPIRLIFDTPSLEALAGAFDKLLINTPGRTSHVGLEFESVHLLFEKQVANDPDTIAVEHSGKTLTYGELNEASNRLAHHLRKLGVRPDSMVAIHLDRSIQMLTAVVAVFKAGGACLPVDLSNPEQRTRAILEDARPLLVLCHDESCRHLFPADSRLVLLPELDLSAQSSGNPEPVSFGENLAYVLYTSGSTGKPKGVLVPHRTLDNLIKWQLGDSSCRPGCKTLQFASLSFDVSFQEIFLTLAEGGQLVLLDEETRQNFDSLVSVISKAAISRLFLPYVALDAIASEVQHAGTELPALMEIITAGEQLKITPAIREFFLRHKHAVLKNQYGPTETHVVTSYTLAGNPLDWPNLPAIGKPIANAGIYLLDEHLKRVADGSEGEIHVGGNPVSRGYLNLESLTCEKFVDSPFNTGERLYKTGDRALRRVDGSYQFLGRTDQQIKFRGYRIELGEIESKLMDFPGIRECAVIVRDAGKENQQLLACILSNEAIKPEAVREFLQDCLPDHMVPAAYECLREFPLNRNGKIDRRRLAETFSVSDVAHNPATFRGNRTQDSITRIWMEILNLPQIGPGDNFFRIGGHSLLATKVVSRIRKHLYDDCSIRLLFENPTIASLSQRIDSMLGQEYDQEAVVESANDAGANNQATAFPASYAQQRLWFIDQFEGGSQQYLIPLLFILRGNLDLKALEAAINAIVQRHQTLRTHFEEREGILYQVVNDQVYIDLIDTIKSATSGQSVSEAVQFAFSEDRQSAFNLSCAPLIRARLVRVQSKIHVLLINVHHVISDGWSNGVLRRELSHFYNAFAKGLPPTLEPLSVNYSDYAEWQQRWLQGSRLEKQKAFWKSYLAGAPQLNLPTDFPRPEVLTYKGGRIRFKLSRDLSERLRKFNLAARTTPFMSLMAAFQVLLSRYSGQTDICVGTPIANRRRVEFEKLIGFFVNTLVIRTDMSGDPPFSKVVERVKDSALDAFAHQDFPFEKMVECLNPARHLNKHPLFQVLFALQNTPGEPLELENLEVEPFPSPGISTHFDLELHIAQNGDQWTGTLSYSSDLFSQETIRKMAQTFPELLEHLLNAPHQPVFNPESAPGNQPFHNSEANGVETSLGDHPKPEFVVPSTILEKQICEIWQRLLKLEKIGIHDNFFEIGGHSLLANQMTMRVSSLVDRSVSLKSFFQNPTISGLIELISLPVVEESVPYAEPSVIKPAKFPVSHIQHRIWFMERFEEGSSQYHMPLLFGIQGKLDSMALERALNTIIERHAPLRTAFIEDGDRVIQKVQPEIRISLEQEHLQIQADQSFENAIQQASLPLCKETFCLEEAPLFRARLYTAGDELCGIVFVFHHLVFDGWSVGLFLSELSCLYDSFHSGAGNPPPRLPIQFGEYVIKQRSLMEDEAVLNEARQFWLQCLQDAPTTSTFEPECSRSELTANNTGICVQTLDNRLFNDLESFARSCRTTLFPLLLAAFKLLLARHTGQRDLVIGTPTSGRDDADIENLIGCFLGTLAIRSKLDEESTFREFIKEVFSTVLKCFEFQSLPFEKLVELIKPDRSQLHSPVFQILFNYLDSNGPQLELKGVKTQSIDQPCVSAKYDLTIYVRKSGPDLVLRAVFNQDLYSSESVTHWLDQYVHLLMQIVDNPDRKLSEYSLVSPMGRALVADPFVQLEEPEFMPVTTLFRNIAMASPSLVAITHDNREWNYKDLETCSLHIAGILLSKGLKPGEVVALTGSRSFGMIGALIGILRARGTFLILDPDLPEPRRDMMLMESRASWMIEVAEHGKAYPIPETSIPSCQRIHLSTDGQTENIEEYKSPEIIDPSPDDRAYIFFTSGSTGKPKGIAGNHKGLSHFIDWERGKLNVSESDRVANLTGLSFDVILRDIFLPLTSGATLCIPDAGIDSSEPVCIEWLANNRISILHTVPSVVHAWMDSLDSEACLPDLKWVLIAGEPLHASLIGKWRAHFGKTSQILNLYGTTETTLAKFFYEIPESPIRGIQPVGHPLPQTQVLVLRSDHRQCGIGEPGEIVIRTPFSTSGYIDAGPSPHDGFRINPFGGDPGDIVYFTGDTGHLDPDGLLRISGRMDNQVKVNGVRIEPEEIAVILATHPAVKHAVILPKDGYGGKLILVAYYIQEKSSVALSAAGLRSYLKSQLPEYMIPSHFMQIDRMPLNRNGKLDRDALPSPDPDSNLVFAEYCPPRTLLEASLVEIWQSVLGITKIGIRDDFFDIGGHSLLATRIVSRIHGQIHRDTQLRSLFDCRTIEALANQIRKSQTGTPGDTTVPDTASTAKTRPASFAQQRLWFLDRLSQTVSPYRIGGSLQLTGPLDYMALQLSVDAIIQRHESFRTCFEVIDGDPCQRIVPSLDVQISFDDLSSADPAPDDDSIRESIRNRLSQPFSLDELPLLRVFVLRIDKSRHIFSWSCHHIISDGWSVNIFYRELKNHYDGFLRKDPYNPPALQAQYTDFSQWQHHRMLEGKLDNQIAYWKEKLADPPILDLPGSFSRPARQSFKGARQSFQLPVNLSQKLDAFNVDSRSTAFMTLMGAFQLLLSRYTGQIDLITGTPIANRNELAYEEVIGFFVNSLCLRTNLSGNPTFRELISRVREASLDAFDNQDVPFEHLVRILNPVRDPSRHPLFQVVFALRNASTKQPSLTGLDAHPYPLGGTTTRFDLELHMTASKQGYSGVLNYCTDLFSTSFIQKFIARYIRLLDFFTSSPEQSIGAWCLADADEKQKVLFEWNQTHKDCHLDMPVHEHFSMQAEQSPKSIALVQDDRNMTYGLLEKRSNQLAHLLVKKEISKGDRVGICLDRSVDFITGILAVLKAGAAYVPLSTDYPPARLATMEKDADIKCILHDGSLPAGLLRDGLNGINLTDECATIDRQPDHSPGIPVSGEDPAYIIFTSGSTGQPKGVVIPHRGIVRLVTGQDYTEFNREENFLFLASPSFDASTFEIWAPLLNGCACAIFTQDVMDIVELEKSIIKHDVSILWLTAGLFNLIVDTHPALLNRLKHVLTGGEALSPGHVKKALSLCPGLRLTNGYGPTESTTFACTHEIKRENLNVKSIPIGRPIANTQAYLVDEYMQPVPPGIPGELLLGGEGLALGYINDPDLTREKFIKNPLKEVPGNRLYRTGDICQYLPDGYLDFIGRNDNQIKIRGFRIELGEIEAACLKHPDVKRAVVVPQKVPGQTTQILAYYVPTQEDDGPDPSQLRAFLSRILPRYAIPAFLCLLPELPLNQNGKVDLKALPDPTVDSPVSNHPDTGPGNPVEKAIMEVWQDLFERKSISPLDNFFDLGGHSLLAAKMLSRIEPLVDKSLPVALLFESPTIRELAVHLEKDERIRLSNSLVVLQSKGQKNPLYCIHGWGGDVYGFLDLARHLAPNRPVYGLQALGLDESTPKHATVEEMAAYYAKEIVNYHDDRPVNLIGYSAGGWIAYAVAQELHSMGKRVNLAMLDTGMSSRIPYWMYFLTKLAHLSCRVPHHFNKWWKLPRRDKVDYLLERFRWLRIGMTRNTDKLPVTRESDGSVKAYENDYFISVAGRYKPSPYNGDLILFSARGRRWYSHLFWKLMIRGRINIHYVDGDHHGIIDRYHVGNFSQLFQEVLENLDNSFKDDAPCAKTPTPKK